MNSTKNINIQYFALFREQRGMRAETVATAASSLRELYGELAKAHGFSLPVERVQVAVDDEFAEWDASVRENATVVFIPPVAGG
jgi:molybdopterin synthase sulfur carrier subunit